jgi:hypothetical protein
MADFELDEENYGFGEDNEGIDDDNLVYQQVDTTPGFVYVITDEQSFQSPKLRVKIGIVTGSRSVESRISEHQTGNPRRIRLIFKHASKAPRIVEHYIHQTQVKNNLLLEWFELSIAEVQQLFNDITTIEADKVPDYLRLSELSNNVSEGELNHSSTIDNLVSEFRTVSDELKNVQIRLFENRRDLILGALGYAGIDGILSITEVESKAQLRTFINKEYKNLDTAFMYRSVCSGSLKVQGVTKVTSYQYTNNARSLWLRHPNRQYILAPAVAGSRKLNEQRVANEKHANEIGAKLSILSDQIKLLLGPYSSYKNDEVKWVRTDKQSFNKEAVINDQPEIYAAFMERLATGTSAKVKFERFLPLEVTDIFNFQGSTVPTE